MNAPDRRVQLGYLPEGEDDGLWRINAYKDPFGPPAWGVCFNDRTPTEFVRAFTTALATAYEQGPDAYLARPTAGIDEHDLSFASSAVIPLLTQGWEIDRHSPRGVFAVHAPDGRAGMQVTAGALDLETELTTRDARWQLWAGKSIDHPASWYATASTDTPAGLLTAVTQSVCDPNPLPRWRETTYSYLQGMAQLTPILPPEPGPTPLDVQRAAASRRPAALPAASVARWSTTSRPAPRR